MRSRFDWSDQSGQEIIWSSVSATVKQASRAGSSRSVTPRTTLVSNGSMLRTPSLALRGLFGVIDDVLDAGDRLACGLEHGRIRRTRLGDLAAPFAALASHRLDLGQRLLADHH